MKAVITPTPLSGTLRAIASKSDAHRHLICAALSTAATEIRGCDSSEDIDATVDCLRALGATIERRGRTLLVQPVGEPVSEAALDCAESGSTLRFMLPVAAAICGKAHVTGRGRLPERPLGDLVLAMRGNGVRISSDRLPIDLEGKLQSGRFELPGNISSQYITGLLLALPLLQGRSEIILTTPLESAGYVDITLNALKLYGIAVEKRAVGFLVPGGQRYRSPGSAGTAVGVLDDSSDGSDATDGRYDPPGSAGAATAGPNTATVGPVDSPYDSTGTVSIEGDWSNAAFFLAAGAIGAPVTVTGLSADSPQGDRAVTSLLQRFGAEVNQRPDQVSISPGELQGCKIDINETPDLLPALAVVSACAKGETYFCNGARLRLKESDRLLATATLLRSLGGRADLVSDGLVVHGGGLTGGQADSFHDHRIAMAAAIAAIVCTEPVTILDAGAVAKSYPAFFTDYQKLGGTIDVI